MGFNHFDIRRRSVTCPVCKEQSLVGYLIEVPLELIDYDDLFLPRVSDPSKIDDFLIVDNLSLFNQYFCPKDIFTYTGDITREGDEYVFSKNPFLAFRRFHKVKDPTDFKAYRFRFFVASLFGNGLDPGVLVPQKISKDEYNRFLNIMEVVFAKSIKESGEPHAIFELYNKYCAEIRWNPLEKLTEDFHHNPTFMASFLEQQLADLLFVIKYEQKKSVGPILSKELYNKLDGLVQKANSQQMVNENLLARIMTQCLILSKYLGGERKDKLLEAAFHFSNYLTRLSIHLGQEMNKNLDSLTRNPDVTMYLHMKLGKMLDKNIEKKSTYLRVVSRRIENLPEYTTRPSSPQMTKINKIGRSLSKHLPEIQ